MSNNNLFRFAGWSAILSIVFSFAMFAFIGGGRGGAFMAVSMVASFFTAAVLYGLYVFHRSQAATLSLAMLICAVVGLILENIGTGPATPLGMVTSIIYGATFLLVGYLGYGNPQMPRWLAILAYVVGGASLAVAVATALGQTALGENVFAMIQFFAWIVWSVGIWRWFLSLVRTATVMA